MAEDAAGLRDWAVMQVGEAPSKGAKQAAGWLAARLDAQCFAPCLLPANTTLPRTRSAPWPALPVSHLRPLPPPPLPRLQVDSVRREMGEEVEALLEAVRRKSAKLADAEVRLTGRLRWGVAMIQAKSEMGIKRQTFMWWR